jgi:ankyrin repeat protein
MDSRLLEQQAQLEAQMAALRQQQKKLQAEQIQIQANKEQTLHQACQQNDLSLIASLISSGVRGNLEPEIKAACEKNNITLVGILLDAKFSANLEHELRVACQKGHIDLVKLLLAHNVNIDCSNGSYHAACDHYDQSRTKQPFEGDAIYNAIKGDHPEVLELLINHAAQQMRKNLLKIKGKLKDSHQDEEAVFCPTLEVLAQQIASVIEANAFQYKEARLSLTTDRKQSLLIEAIKIGSIKCAKFLALKYKPQSIHNKNIR